MRTGLFRRGSTLSIVALLVLTSGCGGPQLVGTGPWPDGGQKKPSDGLAYYLPVDKITVNAIVTVTSQMTVDEKVKLTQVVQQSSTSTVGVTTVADTSKYYILNILPNGTKDQTLDVSVGPDGLLTSINYVGTDRVSQMVTNIAKFTADVAGTLLPAPFKTRSVPPDLYIQTFESTALGISDKADITAGKAGAQEKYNADLASFRATPPLTVYFLNQSPGGRSLWDKRVELDQSLGGLIQTRIDKLLSAKDATKDQIDLINSEATTLNSAISAAQDRRDKVQTSFQAALDQFTSEQNLGPTSPLTATINSVLDIADLATADDVTDAQSNVPLLIQRLKGSGVGSPFSLENAAKKKAWGLLRDTGLILTIAPVNANAPMTRDDPTAGNSSTARFAYREATPYILTTYTLRIGPKGDNTDSKLTQTDSRIVSLIPPNAPTLYVAYNPQAFSDQKLALNFSQGRLSSVSQGATAYGANAVGGVATATDTGITTYGTALTQQMNNQKTAQAILANQLSSQLSTLQTQKSILDARIANQGEQADSKLILQKQELDQQYATLQSQVTTATEVLNAPLIVQQSNANQQLSTLQAQQALANYQSTAQMSAQQAIVTAQINLLTQQVSLLTQQIADMNQQAALKKAGGQ